MVPPLETSEAVAKAVVEAATYSEASLIITLTHHGKSARLISKHRPRCPILVLAKDAHVGAACNLHRGCIPFHCPPESASASEDERLLIALRLAKSNGLARSGDRIVLTYGAKSGTNSLTSFRLFVLA